MAAFKSSSLVAPIALLAAVFFLLCTRGPSFIFPSAPSTSQTFERAPAAVVAGTAAMLAAAPMPAYAGGMFDFGLTLPFVAVTFLAMMTVLNALWYGPVTAEVDERNAKLLQTLSEATDMLTKADEMQVAYTADIREARDKASKALSDARDKVSKEIAASQASAAAARDAKVNEVKARLDKEVREKMQSADGEIEKRKAEFVKATLAGVGM
eukprot:TRINITY_DN3181_c0_g1_i9.p1 TRINITY_DN3181_c0_g1~~TRINITY_DN3181_c0_g1_i9.p1  ORF type:complete len:211 (-),score=75.10 TRINITY_DN3181_c0_g1_i9:82-714(-)